LFPTWDRVSAEKAKENLGERDNVSYNQVDIQEIPFGGKSFDVVIANSMLYHVPDIEKAIREVCRVLKDGGMFYCATYGEHNFTDVLMVNSIDYNPRSYGGAFYFRDGKVVKQLPFDRGEVMVVDV